MSDQDIDVEKTIDNIEKFGEANPKELEAAPKEEAPYLAFKSQDDFFKHQLEYKADEKPIKEDLATILKRAQQGYHYAQNMHKLKADRETFENERKTIQQMQEEARATQDKWSKFETYAKENPEWYDHWSSAWENRQQGLGQQSQSTADDFDARLNAALEQRLKPFEGLLSEKQQAEQRAKIAEQDRQLDDQVKSIRGKYKNIDFDRTDPETGKNLEFRVLEFMQENGMNRFDLAFKAFYHDDLVKMEMEKSKETAQKIEADKRKQGIVDVKTVPGSKRQVDTRNMNYDQITALAMRELGINQE